MKYDRIIIGVLTTAAGVLAVAMGVLAAAAFSFSTETAAATDPAVQEESTDRWLSLREEEEIHARYLNGSGLGLFEPSKALSRAEAAQIFYTLLEDPPEVENTFADVPEGAWFAQAAGALARAGVIPGDADGLFHPDEPFTRAEFAAAAAYFLPPCGIPYQFEDMPADDPRAPAVAAAVAHGLFTTSGPLFRPDDPLTRAEAAVVFNRLLGRSPDTDTIASSPLVRFFPDVPESHWAYAQIMEATIGHSQEPGEQSELWLTLDEERNPLPDGFYNLDGSLYCTRDGKFVRSSSIGGFSFGADGRLTTGNTALDSQLAAVIRNRTNDSMTNAQKLRAVYNYVRDNFTYIKRNLVSRGQTGWEPSYAEAFLRDGRGNCFGYAATFCLLARELGYDAHTVVGWLGKNRQPHGWVEIELDGTTCVYDAELEMKYRSSNFFQARYGNTRFAYYKN